MPPVSWEFHFREHQGNSSWEDLFFFNVFVSMVGQKNSCGKLLIQNFTLKKCKYLGTSTRNFSFMKGTHSFLPSVMPRPGGEFSLHKRLRKKINILMRQNSNWFPASIFFLLKIFLFIGLGGVGFFGCFAFFFLRKR